MSKLRPRAPRNPVIRLFLYLNGRNRAYSIQIAAIIVEAYGSDWLAPSQPVTPRAFRSNLKRDGAIGSAAAISVT
jgi:hypothetical protein